MGEKSTGGRNSLFSPPVRHPPPFSRRRSVKASLGSSCKLIFFNFLPDFFFEFSFPEIDVFCACKFELDIAFYFFFALQKPDGKFLDLIGASLFRLVPSLLHSFTPSSSSATPPGDWLKHPHRLLDILLRFALSPTSDRKRIQNWLVEDVMLFLAQHMLVLQVLWSRFSGTKPGG